MRLRLVICTLAAMCLAAAFETVALLGQSVPDTVAGHVAAAQAAGGKVWPSLVKELCTPAEVAAPPARGGQPPGPPYWGAAKVFDNMYLFATTLEGVTDVDAWALTTSDGIILIDVTYDYSVKELILDGMRKVNLDPAQIKDVIISHGHNDHFAGLRYVQDQYNPRVYSMDWDLILAPKGRDGKPVTYAMPKMGITVTDGQKLTLGQTTLTMYHMPGHTPGTISMIIPTTINGTPHTIAYWGGNRLGRDIPIETLKQYSASAKRFIGIATRAKADIMISNHERFGEHVHRLEQMKADPQGPNPFIVGTDGVVKYLQVLDHCSQAIVAALQQQK